MLDRAAEKWGEPVRLPLRQALSSVGGLRGLGTAPIDVAYGGSSAARGGYARRFREGWAKGVQQLEAQERHALTATNSAALLGA